MIIVAVGLLGLVLGSFVNALVWRLHEQAALSKLKASNPKPSKAKKTTKQASASVLSSDDLSIMKGRSMCPSCHHTLQAKDLVPVFSWLYLRGKCRYCRAPIPDSPFVEIGTTILFLVSYISWPVPIHGVGLFQLIVWFFFLVSFMALAVYDLRWFMLPDKIVYPLIAVAIAEVAVVSIWQHSWMALWQPVVGATIIFGLFYGLFEVSKGTWIGGGDVKIALALGLIAATPLHAVLIIFFASLLGTIGSIPVLLQGKKSLKAHIPFGPYLLLATVLIGLYGVPITDWYTRIFLPGY